MSLFPIVPSYNAEPSLPTIGATLAAHYRADLGVTKDGSNIVSKWDDQSGNNRHLTEATLRPTWVASGIGGQNAINFANHTDRLTATFTLAQPHHFFIVFNTTTHKNFYVLASGQVDEGLHGVKAWVTSGQLVNNAGSATGNTVSYTVGADTLMASFFNNADSHNEINDTGEVDTTSIGTTGISKLHIGGDGGGATGMNGYIAEVILYSSKVTGTDLTSIKDYLSTRYSLGF